MSLHIQLARDGQTTPSTKEILSEINITILINTAIAIAIGIIVVVTIIVNVTPQRTRPAPEMILNDIKWY